MRVLLPTPSEDADLHAFYARDWIEDGGVRMNFISSVDGAVTVSGLSRGLQTPGDNAVFAALRDLADVVLVGAGTARDESYKPANPSAARREKRADYGLSPAHPIALVSRSLRLDLTSPLFIDAHPDARTIVITCQAGDPAVRQALAATADVLVLGEQDVDLTAAVAALRERGFTRILSEGGPTLFGEMAAAGLVDELDLSISPLLAGPGARRITGGQLWAAPLGLTLTGLLEEDDALFARYRGKR
jgi:riboflavin biosynthesis pyrimidine reductase